MIARKTRVLVVDDEPGFTCVLKLSLEGTGRFVVRAEQSAQAGFAAAKAFHPDVILLDVIMPEADGGDLARMLEADPATADIPVIFVTALVEHEETAMSGLLSAGRVFIPKPASVVQVIGCIEDALAGHRPAGGAAYACPAA